MIASDEARRLKIREAALLDEFQKGRPDYVGAAPCLLARTKTLNTYPSNAASFFACEPLAVLGAEVEGGPGTVSGNGTTFFAMNLGATVPPVGAQVIVTYVFNRWVFRYDT